jgi:arsenate reductase
MSAHWPFEDPAAFEGAEAEKRALFARVYGYIANRIGIFISLPIASLDRLSLQKRLDEMGAPLRESA